MYIGIFHFSLIILTSAFNRNRHRSPEFYLNPWKRFNPNTQIITFDKGGYVELKPLNMRKFVDINQVHSIYQVQNPNDQLQELQTVKYNTYHPSYEPTTKPTTEKNVTLYETSTTQNEPKNEKMQLTNVKDELHDTKNDGPAAQDKFNKMLTYCNDSLDLCRFLSCPNIYRHCFLCEYKQSLGRTGMKCEEIKTDNLFDAGKELLERKGNENRNIMTRSDKDREADQIEKSDHDQNKYEDQKVIEPKFTEPKVIEPIVVEPKVIEPIVVEPTVIESKVIEPKVIVQRVVTIIGRIQ